MKGSNCELIALKSGRTFLSGFLLQIKKYRILPRSRIILHFSQAVTMTKLQNYESADWK
jgi:hypothetical protein